MLINLGILASSGSLIAVPDLSGLNKTVAATTITNAGLVPIDGGSTNTGDTNLNNIVASQSPAAGTLVELGTQVTYTWFTYVAPPFFPPFFPPPFFPPFFPFFPTFVTTTYYCTTQYVDVLNTQVVCVQLDPSTTDQTGSQCDSYATVCSTTAYPSCPSIPSCAPPFFPPFFPPPFFPPFFPFFPTFVTCTTVGEICNTVTNEFTCTTDVYVYDANCGCVYSYTGNFC